MVCVIQKGLIQKGLPVLPGSPWSISKAPWQTAEPREGKRFPISPWRHLFPAKTLALFHLCC